MRAVVVPALGAAPVLAERPDPVPAAGESLVRLTAASLAHVDRSVAAGALGVHPPPPYVPGTDGSGVVVASATVPAGTEVWVRGSGVGTARDGTAAELVAVPDAAVHRLEDGADPLLAACAFSPVTSAWTALHVLGRVAAGERVLVAGAAGAVGSLAVQLAHEAGALVVGSVSRPERLPAVPPVATAVVEGASGPPADLLVDLLVDTVGGPRLPGRLAAVRPGGRAVLLGYTAGTRVELDLPSFLRRDVALLPLDMVRRAEQAFAVADELLLRLSKGELHLRVTRYPLADAPRLWADLAAGRVDGRAVLLP